MPFYALARKTMMKQGDEFLTAEERSILADPVKYLQDVVENNKFNINNYEKELAESTPKELEKSYLSTGLSRKEYIKKSINKLKDSTLKIETLIKKVEDVIKKPKVDVTTDLSNSKAPKDSEYRMLGQEKTEGMTDAEIELFKEWHAKNVPNIPFEILDRIITTHDGQKAWGVFEDGVAKFYKGGQRGT